MRPGSGPPDSLAGFSAPAGGGGPTSPGRASLPLRSRWSDRCPARTAGLRQAAADSIKLGLAGRRARIEDDQVDGRCWQLGAPWMSRYGYRCG